MKLTSTLRLSLLALTLAAGLTRLPAQEFVGNLGAGTLRDRSGVALPAGNLVLLLADTSHNGFGSLVPGSSLDFGSFLNGDDQILGRLFTDADSSASGSLGPIPLANNPTPGAFTELNPGDPLAIVWFTSLTESSTVLSFAEYYGLFSNGVSPTDGDDAWEAPSSGLINLSFITIDFDETGTHNPTEAFAIYSTSAPIPEPATSAAFAGLLTLGLVAYRRRLRA